MSEVLHFSEDPGITRFEPHVPPTNPSMPPLVWAIDAAHAGLYWFPRDCPRITYWSADEAPPDRLGPTAAHRVHAIEARWLDRVRACQLHEYRFDGAPFEAWAEAEGQWVASESVEPISVEPVGDLLARHVDAGIELRIVPSLQVLVDPVMASGYQFSMVRMANAQG
ncbi:MAG: DUF6886 family protein [Acidimicrobiales bacterium]